MKPATLILRTILGWIALVLAQIIANLIFPISVPGALGAVPWLLLTYFLTVVILAYIAQHADLRGWKLGFALTVIPAAIALRTIIRRASCRAIRASVSDFRPRPPSVRNKGVVLSSSPPWAWRSAVR